MTTKKAKGKQNESGGRRRVVDHRGGGRGCVLSVVRRHHQTTEQGAGSFEFSLASFRDSGLVESFESAAVNHILTTMLERLKALDQKACAHGFACAFLEEHLLITLKGMSWHCPSWRILKPVDTWLQGYAAWLAGLVDLPVEIVHTLNLAVPSATSGASYAPTVRPAIPIDFSSGQVFSSGLWRLVGEGGMALICIASGSLLGEIALFGAWYGLKEGYSSNLFCYFWGLISVGILYGAFAIVSGVREVARLAWRWNSPLRTLQRP